MSADSEALLRDLLVRAREAAGFTQAELGRRLSKPQSYISKIETGERGVDLIELIELLDALSVDIHSFIDDFRRRIAAGRTMT
jgi:transcriptional regulator with XRE-family HTH domain